jgi:hypothetical protein
MFYGPLNKAYLKMDTVHKAISGFGAAGVWLLNAKIFTEVDFERAQ